MLWETYFSLKSMREYRMMIWSFDLIIIYCKIEENKKNEEGNIACAS